MPDDNLQLLRTDPMFQRHFLKFKAMGANEEQAKRSAIRMCLIDRMAVARTVEDIRPVIIVMLKLNL